MLLFQIFDAIVRLIIVANLALVLFVLSLVFKVVMLPLFLFGRRAYAGVDDYMHTKSVKLLSFIWNGPNHMK